MAREQHSGESGRVEPSETGRPQGGIRVRGPRRRSDENIGEDIRNLLAENPDLDASGIEMHVEGGDVTLSGLADSRDARWMAEDLTGSVAGVREIHNRIRVMRN